MEKSIFSVHSATKMAKGVSSLLGRNFNFGLQVFQLISGHWIPFGRLDFARKEFRAAAVFYESFVSFYQFIQIGVTITFLLLDAQKLENTAVVKPLRIIRSNQNMALSLIAALIFQFHRKLIVETLANIKVFVRLPGIRFYQKRVERKISSAVLIIAGVPIIMNFVDLIVDFAATFRNAAAFASTLVLNDTVAKEVSKNIGFMVVVPKIGQFLSQQRNSVQDAFALCLIYFVCEELKILTKVFGDVIFYTNKQAFEKELKRWNCKQISLQTWIEYQDFLIR